MTFVFKHPKHYKELKRLSGLNKNSPNANASIVNTVDTNKTNINTVDTNKTNIKNINNNKKK